ncbi:O-antigen ligase family protein, partial [Candidatus Sumerlaeota bacterium]|nr:O-antigen ligase family protein [Candidatus Sumerlaeota bacterium]
MLGMVLAVLWLAGGASRGDAAGQIFVRAIAFLALVGLALSGRRPTLADVRPVWFILGAAIVIALLQLFPLPVESWQALPGRDIVGSVPEPGLWRSLSIVPGATINALGALVVPVAVLVAATTLTPNEEALLPGAVLILVTASMLVGLLQFSGLVLDNPLINDTPGVVSGTFANRNHFALFLALGCLVIPLWVFRDGHRSGWRGPAGFGLLLLFMLTILATGSRAGMAVGALAIGIAGALSWRGLRRELRHTPKWVLPAVIAAAVGILVALVSVSVFADRAVSIQRSLSIDVEQDMRSRAFPIVSGMTRTTFPVGAGLGSFDPVFRTHEPIDLLKPTYFNQAHNDFLEILFGAGLPGGL